MQYLCYMLLLLRGWVDRLSYHPPGCYSFLKWQYHFQDEILFFVCVFVHPSRCVYSDVRV